MYRNRLCVLLLAVIVAVGCSSVPTQNPTAVADEDFSAARGMQAPSGDDKGPKGPVRISGDSARYEALGPFPINLADIPAGVYDPFNKLDMGNEGGRYRSLISEEKAAKLREKSMTLKPNPLVQPLLGSPDKAVSIGTSFDSLDYNDCCGGGGNVPPDPELAVGPNHVIAVVNVAFEIYDKSGNLLSGPTTFSSFFAGTPGCSNTGVFDPN
ncbi:MAG: hypothetical protein GY953_27105, partial [bacterium]|nr:hypothetical protein [bacterium]